METGAWLRSVPDVVSSHSKYVAFFLLKEMNYQNSYSKYPSPFAPFSWVSLAEHRDLTGAAQRFGEKADGFLPSEWNLQSNFSAARGHISGNSTQLFHKHPMNSEKGI